MAFKKGHKKVGGRAKGTPNKTTAIREAMTKVFGSGDAGAAILEKLFAGINSQAPFQQVDALLELLPYFFSKEKAVEEHEIKGGIEIKITDYGTPTKNKS